MTSQITYIKPTKGWSEWISPLCYKKKNRIGDVMRTPET